MKMSNEEKIKGIIHDVLGVDIIEITYTAHLKYDLGASDSQLSEIVNKIEETFSIIIGFESFDMTVEDLLVVVFSEIQETDRKPGNKPRPVHYAFAHQIIPALAFNSGNNFFLELRYKKGFDYMKSTSLYSDIIDNTLPKKEGMDFLYDLWKALSNEYGYQYVDIKGLDYEIVEKSNRLMILFRFPEPETFGEAYYSLFVWCADVPVDQAAKYYTLELTKENNTIIGEWMKDGTHSSHGSYNFVLTPTQFIDAIIKDLLPHEDTSIIDEKNDQTESSQFLVDGQLQKEHIYLKIIVEIAHKLNQPASEIKKETNVQGLVKQDYIDIINAVYQIYNVDPSKYRLFIKQDVDELVKIQGEQNLDCSKLVIKICQHFERRIAGDYDNPKALYQDYRFRIDLISQSPEFSLLYNFISRTYPSFITDNAQQETIEDKDLLYKEVLALSDKHLSHNYPVDPRGLFICLVAVAMSLSRHQHDIEKATKYIESAIVLNTKWGPYIKPVTLEKILIVPAKEETKDTIVKTVLNWFK